MEHHFIGIKIKGEAAEKTAALQKDLETETYFKHLPEKEDFHLTLLFLGGWEKEGKNKLWKALKEKEFMSFSLVFQQYSFFGKKEQPRVLFLRPEEQPDLQHLYDTAAGEAFRLGFPQSKKTFQPHLTFAKKFRGHEPFPHSPFGSVGAVEEKVEEITLFKVHPQKLPRYEPVSTISFVSE